MRILHIIPQFPYFGGRTIVGGHASCLLNLALAQHNSGNQVTILSYTQGAIGPKSIDGGPVVHSLFMSAATRTISFGLQFCYAALKWVGERRHDFDVVHMHSGYADYFLLSGRIKEKFKLPTIHTMYCPIPERGGRSRLPGIHALVCRWANQLNSCFGISENVMRSMAGYGVKQPGCIRPALDLIRFADIGDSVATRRELGLAIDDQVILFVGNAKPQKNALGALGALQKLRHEFPKAKLIITTELKHSSTDVDLTALADAVRSMKLESSIVQRGIVNDMPALMRASDVLVAPFLDTYGPSDYFMAALEAMACSRPVVVSNVGGMPEIISDNVGRLVDPKDRNSIAAGLRSFLSNDEERRASGAKARNLVERSFHPDRIVQEYNAVYERILQ